MRACARRQGCGQLVLNVAVAVLLPLVGGSARLKHRNSHGHPMSAMTVPHLPAAVGARVHVEGHGLGTYVRFDYNVLSPVLHCIDFDECGEKTFRGDSSCRDRCT